MIFCTTTQLLPTEGYAKEKNTSKTFYCISEYVQYMQKRTPMCAGVLAVCILKWGPEVKVGIFITPLSFSFNFKKIFYYSVCTGIFPACTSPSCSACRGQRKALDTLGLGLQLVMSHYMVAGNQTGSSEKAASARNCWAIYPDPN